MKNKRLKYISTLLFILFTIGCSEDFVELKPIAQPAEDTYYTTMIAADNAITACYSTFCMEKLWDLTIMMTLGSISSDEAEAGAGGKSDVVEFQHVDQLLHQPTEANVFEWSWGYLFRTIKFCNVAIEKLPGITKESDPQNFNEELLKHRIGEAYFLRAYNYFTLAQIYGGVPIYDKTPGPDEYNKKRNSIAEVYSLVKEDLHKAIDMLPNRDGWKTDIGRTSKGAAQALLSKVFLYESSYAKYYPGDNRFTGCSAHWDSALFYAKQVIDYPKYTLVGIDGTKFNTWRGPNTGGYQYVFMLDGDNSPESVFEVQNVQDGQGWFDTRGTALIKWCAPRKVNRVKGEAGDGVDLGWGWWCPTDFLYNQYEAGDPRREATILTANDSINCFPDKNGQIVWAYPNFNILQDQTGLHMNTRKYECSYNEYWLNSKSWQDGPIDLKLIRLADVVLFAAEAAFESGNTADALIYINKVRTRARNSGNSGLPADLTAITHDDIVHERLVELAMEGHRFFDLVRWNLADKYLNHKLADGSDVVFEKGKHEFFPIPAKEVGLSGGVLEQNPGWE